jgi:predicted O-methyltransferase YrrM
MLHEAQAYLRYRWRAQNAHGLHSPFMYALYTQAIVPDAREYYAFARLESLRERLLQAEREIEITDFGAGSRIFKTNVRKVKDVAKHCLGSPKESRLLFRLIQHLKPHTMLELGTSLGVNTLYQALAQPQGRMVTFEGCPATAALAQEHFREAGGANIEVVVGNIDDTLAPAVAKLPAIDYAFFDANHRYGPTMDYFRTCLEKAHEGTVFIFDDIHWSEGMEQAWEEIKAHPRVTLTADIFQLGLVFFRAGQPKQHFVLQF